MIIKQTYVSYANEVGLSRLQDLLRWPQSAVSLPDTHGVGSMLVD